MPPFFDFNDRFDSPMVSLGLALAGGGTPQEGLANLASAMQARQRLAQQQRESDLNRDLREREFGFRQSESDRAQSNADRLFEFNRAQAEAAAKGYEIRDLDGQLVRIEKATGRVTLIQPEGAPTAPTNPYAYPGGKPMTESQSKDALYASRMFNAEKVFSDPAVTGAGMDLTEKARGGIPVIGNYLTSENYQAFDQAQRDFVNATLRRESGAVISESEFDNARKQYLPQPGDSEKVLAQKRANRVEAIKGFAAGAGKNYRPPYLLDEGGGRGRSEVPAAPAIGQREVGKVYSTPKGNYTWTGKGWAQ